MFAATARGSAPVATAQVDSTSPRTPAGPGYAHSRPPGINHQAPLNERWVAVPPSVLPGVGSRVVCQAGTAAGVEGLLGDFWRWWHRVDQDLARDGDRYRTLFAEHVGD